MGRPDGPLRIETRLTRRPDLPTNQTSFVGRAMELSELAELLAAPTCRLLTIIGPGGIGKTRLALEAAAAARDTFADGVAFVPLQAVVAAEALAPAIAAAVGCPLTGQGDAREQVMRYLRPTRLLLVLDNFEQLIEEAPWLADLLEAAPGLCLLTTSREALNLREEWRYPLAGLAVPVEEADDPDQAEAVRLFVERAQQVRRDFSLAADREAVARICCLTEGLPLALELAAAWVRTLPCAAIATEIERNIAFLATDLRNVPSRHRSMRAVFDHSWERLSNYEQHIFRRLVVFRGGFSREAAERVAGATLPLLSSLVDKSLVRYEADERFHLHELLRQYAAEHLRTAPEEAKRIYAAHRDFYLTFVAEHAEGIAGGAQIEAVAAIAAELDNIREAWRHAVVAGDGEAVARVAHPLALFYDFRARYHEGLATMEEGVRVLRAADASPQTECALAGVLINQARFHHRVGQIPALRAVLTESEQIYARLACHPPPGQMTDPQLWRGILALIDGDYAEAARLGEEIFRSNTVLGRPGNMPLAWWIRAMAALWLEEIDAAEEYARRGTEAATIAGDRWHLAYARNQQGHVAVARGAYAEARGHYAASYALREEFDDPEGMGTSLVHQAKVAALQGDWAEAEGLYRRSLATARDVSDPVTLALALNGLGLVACAAGDYATAGQHFAEGLRQTTASRFMRLLLAFLASVGGWLVQTGQPEAAAGPLILARNHPASDNETRARARQLIADAQAALPPGTFDAAGERVRDTDPAALAADLLPLLASPPIAVPALPERARSSSR